MELSAEKSLKQNLLELFRKQGIVIVFALLIIVISLFTDRFLTTKNILRVLRQVSVKGIMACGMTYMLIGGHFDLSVGSIVSFTTVLAIDWLNIYGALPAILLVLLVGVLIGCINGFLVGVLELNSLIVTFGMLFAIQAVTLIYTGGNYMSVAHPDQTWFGFLGGGYIFGIPVPVVLFLLFVIVFQVVLKRSVYGRYVYSVGSNPEASEYSGVRKKLIGFSTFILTGITAATAGILLSSRIMSAQNYLGQGYEFDVISAVVLGGTSLFGGSGSIFKTLIGVLILGFLKNGMLMLGFPYYTQWIVQWGILIGAVWIDIATERGKVLV